MQSALDTPVVLILFNRPEPTRKVFAEIARARPKKLLVIADGPRAHVPGERERCEAARAVIKQVDWECEVLTEFSEANLGCKRRVSSGLTWAFEQVEEAIILEDDCVPDPSFFPYCQELLARYRNDQRVMLISGTQMDSEKSKHADSYHFARIPNIWGWASWRRAWKSYDVTMAGWPEFKRRGLTQSVVQRGASFWESKLQRTFDGSIDTWDYQWLFAIWRQSGLSICPKVNMITNIGFDRDATHTQVSVPWANLPRFALSFPLQHPEFVLADPVSDERFTAMASDLKTRVTQKARRLILGFRSRFSL